MFALSNNRIKTRETQTPVVAINIHAGDIFFSAFAAVFTAAVPA